MNLKRLLSALPWFDLPSQVARDLKRLEIHDAADVALVEWALIGGFENYTLFLEWLENWPPPEGLHKAHCTSTEFWTRLERLAKVGAIKRGQELAPGDAVKGLIGGYPRAATSDDEPPTLELDSVSAALRASPSERSDGAERFLKNRTDAWGSLAQTDLDALTPNGSQIAESLLAACAVHDELEACLAKAIGRLAADLPGSDPVGDAARILICGFSTEVATWFVPHWLVVGVGVENRPRRDHFARMWLHFTGVRYRVSGFEESAVVRGTKLVSGDPRRSKHWTDETEMQDRLQRTAKARIDAAVAAREVQKKAYASGRRE